MKKIALIFLTATLLLSCSAERRLAVFLTKHPELQRIDTVQIHDTIIRPQEKESVNFTIDDLAALTAQTTSQDTTMGKCLTSPTIKVETNGAIAEITPNADGSFSLTSTQKPDTVYKDKIIKVPSYRTHTEYKDRIIYKTTPWQDFWIKFGLLSAIFILLAIAIHLTQKYL